MEFPRLLDFGIAKVLDPQLLYNPAVTRTDWRPMTPRYASPEQVRGGPITNATDVYSLGVLLYELLTGRCPYEPGHVSSAGLEHSVCEEDPEKPSTVISRLDQARSNRSDSETTPGAIANYRGTSPDDLRRSLRGDLDTIVLKAIHKDPAQRYSSVKEFSEDIQQFLDGRPIKARRPTFAYRTGKFVRRHKESFATAVSVLAVTVALGTWQALRLAKNFDTAQRQGAASQIRVRPSFAVLGFKNILDDPKASWVSTAFSEMLASEMSAGEQLRVVPGELVARTKIDLGLQDEESLLPETLVKIRKNLGIDYMMLGSYSSAPGMVRLDIRLVDAVRGETVVAASDTASDESLKDLISRVGARLRQQFGVGQLSQIEAASVLAESPSNPAAAQLFYQGLVKLRNFDSLGAKDLLTRAVAADASCALADSALANAWSSLGYDPQAREAAKQALDMAGSLSREKHLVVEGQYYEASKQWDKAIATYRTLNAFFRTTWNTACNWPKRKYSDRRGKMLWLRSTGSRAYREPPKTMPELMKQSRRLLPCLPTTSVVLQQGIGPSARQLPVEQTSFWLVLVCFNAESSRIGPAHRIQGLVRASAPAVPKSWRSSRGVSNAARYG